MAIERRVIVAEALEVRQVSWTDPVVDGDHQTGTRGLSSHSARRLDVFGSRLWLAEHCHQPEAINVDADRDHVAGQHRVKRERIILVPWRMMRSLQAPEQDGD